MHLEILHKSVLLLLVCEAKLRHATTPDFSDGLKVLTMHEGTIRTLINASR
jgi:hypothetical protein